MGKPAPAQNPRPNVRPLLGPKPEARNTPTQDEFDAWLEHPVSRYVAAAWAKAATIQQQAWTAASWSQEDLGPRLLQLRTELRTRADAYMAFLETGLNDYERILQEDR